MSSQYSFKVWGMCKRLDELVEASTKTGQRPELRAFLLDVREVLKQSIVYRDAIAACKVSDTTTGWIDCAFCGILEDHPDCKHAADCVWLSVQEKVQE